MARKFAVLILTHGRPNRVLTFDTLRKYGYTGDVFIVVDDEDRQLDKYIDKFGDKIRVFSKAQIAERFDEADNFQDRRAIVYARNAAWDIAESEGLTHFVQLDDDYTQFQYRFNERLGRAVFSEGDILRARNMDEVFACLCDFLDSTTMASVAMAQGGDFIGGASTISFSQDTQQYKGIDKSNTVTFMRKAMNSFVCRTDRRFWFVGRINEDVNTYTSLASLGLLLGSTNQVSLEQISTQQGDGGMTDIYKSFGTYVKSFYSVMFQPSAVSIRMMGSNHQRLHHSVNWDCAVPKIIPEALRKPMAGGRER